MTTRSVRGEEFFGNLYEKGAVIFREGDRGDALFVIQSGAVEVSREQGGRRVVVAPLERGDFFGEMALVDDERRSATVTAIATTRLLPITRRSFHRRVAADPGVALHLLRTLSLRIEKMRVAEGFEAPAAPGPAPGPRLRLDRDRADVVSVAAGETVFRQGEPGIRCSSSPTGCSRCGATTTTDEPASAARRIDDRPGQRARSTRFRSGGAA